MNKLEQLLAKKHHRKYSVLVGNGTTALYLALKAQNIQNKKVALPNNVCMNVLLPIYFSNNTPVFLDIDMETLGIDLSKAHRQQFDVLIAVHAYGNVCDIEKIEAYCKKHSIYLIEDLAVAQGLSFKERCIGSFGDISIVSFGSGKVVDIGHGGALLMDDETLYKNVCAELCHLKQFEDEDEAHIDAISKKHTKLYNLDFGKGINTFHSEFKALCLNKKHHFLYQFSDKFAAQLEKALQQLDFFIKLRQKNSRYIANKFRLANVDTLKVFEPKFGSSYWRLTLFVTLYRDELFKFLLEKRYKISSWYHSVDLLFEKRISLETPISDYVGGVILNIWVNEEIDITYLDNISEDIIHFLREKECHK